MKKMLFILLVLLSVIAFAKPNFIEGQLRTQARIGTPLALTRPLDFVNRTDSGEYKSLLLLGLEAGYGIGRDFELTFTLTTDSHVWDQSPGYTVDISATSIALGCNAYLIPNLTGLFRLYGHLELGISFHGSDIRDSASKSYSTGYGFGLGVGAQVFFGETFFVEPFVLYRLHGNDNYSQDPGSGGVVYTEKGYEGGMPMTLGIGLGMGIVF